MTFFQNVYQELVERRLLPLAVLLVLALVAVPLTLSKSMPNTPPTAASGATPELDIPSAVPAVSLTSPDRGGRLDHLKALNPFEQRHKPHVKVLKTVSTPSATAAPAAGQHSASAPSSTVASSSGASIGSASASAPASLAGPSAPLSSPFSGAHAPVKHLPRPRYLAASLQVRFGAIGHTGNRRGLDRLSPLPRRGTPVVIYLGLLRDRNTAVFLLSSDVHAEGDGHCSPSPSNCEKVYLRAGQTEFFDQTNSRGEVMQYQLDVIGVAKRAVASASAARRVSARVSRRGQRLERHSVAFRARTPR